MWTRNPSDGYLDGFPKFLIIYAVLSLTEKNSHASPVSGAERSRQAVSIKKAARLRNGIALQPSGRGHGRGRDRGRDHPSRGQYANDDCLRPTTCGRESSTTHALRAIRGARVPPVCFPIHCV